MFASAYIYGLDGNTCIQDRETIHVVLILTGNTCIHDRETIHVALTLTGNTFS